MRNGVWMRVRFDYARPQILKRIEIAIISMTDISYIRGLVSDLGVHPEKTGKLKVER